MIDLRRINLNLLVIFEVLMNERHVGRAANKLGLTQSAVSHALVRLRDTVNDPLFVRHPKGVEPTRRALELAPLISDILDRARSVLVSEPEFDASRSYQFTIGATDGAVNAVIIPLMQRLRHIAPAVVVNVLPTHHESIVSAIDRMDIDVAISVFSADYARMVRIPIFEMDFVAIVRADHPALKDGDVDIETFAALPHLVVSAQIQASESIDRQFAERGLKRSVAMVQPHYLAAPLIVACTDMVAIVERNLANMFADSHNLLLFDPPIKPPPMTLDLMMSRARASESALRWIAEQIAITHSAQPS